MQAVSSASAEDVLTNPVLLPIIFAHLPPERASQLRLVNRAWNKAAIPVLKKHAPYMALLENYDEKDKDKEQMRRLIQLMDCVVSSNKFPFTKLSIGLTPFLNGPAWNMLLRSVAPLLTHLIISGDLDVGPSLPGDIHFPKLKHLEMYLYVRSEAAADGLSIFLEKLVSAAPNLKSLELWNTRRRVLQQLTCHPNLHLEKVTLEFSPYEDFQSHEHLVNFLISQKGSLQKLSLSAPTVRCFVEVNMISYSLPNLKALHLNDNTEVDEPEEDDTQHLYENSRLRRLEYMNKFPNLEEVHLDRSQCQRFTDFFAGNNGVPSTSVTSLQLSGVYKTKCQMAIVKYVPVIFPNLTTLQIGTSFTTAVELVARLEHLEALIVNCRYTKSADQIFGGLDLQDWHKYGRISLQPFGVIRDFQGMMDKPPYSAWHKIRILKFDFWHGSRFPVSEATCRLVLLQMRNLKKVHFTGRKPSEDEISAAVMKQMEAKFTVFSPMDD